MIGIYPQYKNKFGLCTQCQFEILKRDPCVMVRWKDGFGYYRTIFYHPECYIEHQEKYLDDWFNAHPRPEPRKRGRKPKSIYPELYRKKKALMRYHKKVGNTERAEEIAEELKGMEIK